MPEKVSCSKCGADNNSTNKYCCDCGYELPKDESSIKEMQVLQLEKEKNEKRAKLKERIVYAVTFSIAFLAVQQIFFKPHSFDKQMSSIASELNKTCPIMIDQNTRLDNAMAMQNNTFQYTYTLINHSKSEVNLDTAKKYIEPFLINSVKSSPELKLFRDHKTTMVYYYLDKNGVFVVKYSVTPDLYQ
jgi:hypothetical protein